MIKKYLTVILFVLSSLLTAAFIGLLLRDYFVVYSYGSAPFYLYVIVRAAEFLLPAIACLIAGFIVKKRGN